MIGSMPGSLWEPVGVKRFDSDQRTWDLEGLSGDEDEIYRITARQNNHAGERDQIRININEDYRKDHYEAAEAYISADYTFGDRKIFTGMSMMSSTFDRVWEKARSVAPEWDGWEVVNPDWRVIRESELGYLTFGMPLPGVNALFGQGLLLATSGGKRSLIRRCSEQHPNGNLMTVGRYTFLNETDEVTQLNFSSEHEGGLGEGSFILVERINLPEAAAEERPENDGARSEVPAE